MKKQKHYFAEKIEEEMCYTLAYLLREMNEQGLTEITVSEAKREVGSDYYYCKVDGEAGSKQDSECGKLCQHYKPRNGKNGCCKNRGFLYEPFKDFTLSIDGTLTEIKQ